MGEKNLWGVGLWRRSLSERGSERKDLEQKKRKAVSRP